MELARVRHQVVQEPHRLGGQLEFPIGQEGAPGEAVEHQVAARDALGGRQGTRSAQGAAQHGADARHQLLGVEGLGQVVVGALVQRSRALEGGVDLREQDDGGPRAARADAAHHLAPVHVGHHDVGDDDVGVEPAVGGQSLLAVAGGVDCEPRAAQEGREAVNDRRLVVDQQDGGSRARRGLRRGRRPGARCHGCSPRVPVPIRCAPTVAAGRAVFQGRRRARCLSTQVRCGPEPGLLPDSGPARIRGARSGLGRAPGRSPSARPGVPVRSRAATRWRAPPRGSRGRPAFRAATTPPGR